MSVLFQIFRHMFGEQNVTRIATIHHPLRHVDPGAGDVRAPAHIGHFAHRPAVNSHSNGKIRMRLERLRNLDRAPRRFFATIAKDERHAIAGRQPNELLIGRLSHLRSRQNDLGQPAQPLLLFFDQELGITDQVDEEDMPDLQRQVVLRFSLHLSLLLTWLLLPMSLQAERRAGRIDSQQGPGQRRRP